MGFVYKLTYKVSRKAYIGQTIRPIEDRLKEHQLESSKCKAISAAIQKYGWENFEKEWYEVPDEDLNFYEEMLVALLGTLSPGGYNLREGGGATGKPSEESKQKMREAHIGMSHTEETRQKMKEAQTGKTLSDEHKQKMKEAKTGEKNHMFGKEHTEESKKKMSDAHAGKTQSEETKQKLSKAMTSEKNHASKKVYQYTIDGIYVDEFASSGEAARALGKTYGSSISKCARGKLPSAYGFKWSRELL
ncbi:GIY-YIG catalytic domain-containing endonuclease [Paramecium bursaria Chlorella virus Fr5L]|nr:GIY-YIG catalytic domain-containing endonuclease [Paramecium bursaria Chlorella virus Fr5L]